MPDQPNLLTFANRHEWRSWLERNHDTTGEAWVAVRKKGADVRLPSFEEAQDEALCFGWTDVKSKGVDELRYSLRFTPRKPGSMWSITNVRRVEQLIEAGLMATPGLERVAEAKQNGQWEAAIRSAQTHIIPPDLESALRKQKGALAYYKGLTDSRKRQVLHSILTAKTEAMRQRRVAAIVQEAARQDATAR